MDTTNDIGKAHRYLPFPFKDFNDENGDKIQNELLYGPDPTYYDSEVCMDDVKSMLIHHFSNDTYGLIEFFDKNGVLFLGSGHLRLHDLIMIIEIFYYHAFCKNTEQPEVYFYESKQLKLYDHLFN